MLQYLLAEKGMSMTTCNNFMHCQDLHGEMQHVIDLQRLPKQVYMCWQDLGGSLTTMLPPDPYDPLTFDHGKKSKPYMLKMIRTCCQQLVDLQDIGDCSI